MPALEPERLVRCLEGFDSPGRIWVAFSGGLDSSVLLAALAEVRSALPASLQAVHVNHGLHPDAARWARHCAAFCHARDVPLVTEPLELELRSGRSLEALARDARYAVFAALLGRGDLLLTAHHQDDQAETLLLALLRGSGVRGLASMPVSARLGRGYLVRPLLQHSRGELAGYAEDMGLDWIEDPSNAQTALDRNFLRHQVMPLLRTRWPAAAATLSRSARHCAEAAGLVEWMAHETLPQLFGRLPGSIEATMLEQLDRPLQKAVLRHWLEQQGYGLPDTVRLERILDEVLPARADASPLVAWDGCEVRRYRGDLLCLAPLPVPPSGALRLPWRVGGPLASLELPQGVGVLSWRPDEGEAVPVGGQSFWVDLDVRFGLSGLRCRAPGGHERPLKDRFQDAGVPSWLRPYVPLIFNGDRLVVIAGVCGCAVARGEGISGRLIWQVPRALSDLGVFRQEISVRLPV